MRDRTLLFCGHFHMLLGISLPGIANMYHNWFGLGNIFVHRDFYKIYHLGMTFDYIAMWGDNFVISKQN